MTIYIDAFYVTLSSYKHVVTKYSSSDIWLKQKAKKSIMIFWKVKAKVKWLVKVKAKEKSIELVKSQRKVQWKMSKLLSIWLALWSKLWKQLFLKLKKMSLGRSQSHSDLTQQLGQYLTEVPTITFWAGSAFTAREFWKTRQAIYLKPVPVAVDILAAPASQAYVERLFSVCGLLCSGHRNRMTRSLWEFV